MLALLDHHLLALGGTYGDPEAGDPIQCDEFRIEHDQGDVEIVVYNRAILLFGTESEAARIHRVCYRESWHARVTAHCEGSPGRSENGPKTPAFSMFLKTS